MPITVWKCSQQHEFEKIESKAPEDSETRTCPTCGEAAKQTFGVPAPPKFAGKPWNS